MPQTYFMPVGVFCGGVFQTGSIFPVCQQARLSNSVRLPFRRQKRLCCGTQPFSRYASNGFRQSSHPYGPALLPLPDCRRLPSSWPTIVGHFLAKPPAPASLRKSSRAYRHPERPMPRKDAMSLEGKNNSVHFRAYPQVSNQGVGTISAHFDLTPTTSDWG